MPGMSTGLKTNNPTIVSALHTALLHQGLVVLLILAVAGITLNALRTLQFRGYARDAERPPALAQPSGPPEPAARRRAIRTMRRRHIPGPMDGTCRRRIWC